MLGRGRSVFWGLVVAKLKDSLVFERALLNLGHVVVGVDEVGRGALAGPLTVGAVVIRDDATPPTGLKDSKLLSAPQRERLIGPLCEWAAAWSTGSVSAAEIDAWGLRVALSVAANRALEALTLTPTHALVDGPWNVLDAPVNFQLPNGVPHLRFDKLGVTTIVHGDRQCATIAAAAVIAKVHRDNVMRTLDQSPRGYGWAENKGYGTAAHLESLRRLGPSDEHRRSWRLPPKSPSDEGDLEGGTLL